MTYQSNLSKLKELGWPNNFIYDIYEGGKTASYYNDEEMHNLIITAINEGMTDAQKARFIEIVDSNIFTEKNREVIRLRFEEFKTYAEIGKDVNVGPERVRQILAKAGRQIKHPLKAKKIFIGPIIKPIEEDVVKPTDKEVLLNSSISELDLGIRPYNCLARGLSRREMKNGRYLRIDPTINDVVQKIKNEGWEGMQKIRNLGKNSIKEISDKLLEHNLISEDEAYVIKEVTPRPRQPKKLPELVIRKYNITFRSNYANRMLNCPISYPYPINILHEITGKTDVSEYMDEDHMIGLQRAITSLMPEERCSISGIYIMQWNAEAIEAAFEIDHFDQQKYRRSAINKLKYGYRKDLILHGYTYVKTHYSDINAYSYPLDELTGLDINVMNKIKSVMNNPTIGDLLDLVNKSQKWFLRVPFDSYRAKLGRKDALETIKALCEEGLLDPERYYKFYDNL